MTWIRIKNQFLKKKIQSHWVVCPVGFSIHLVYPTSSSIEAYSPLGIFFAFKEEICLQPTGTKRFLGILPLGGFKQYYTL